MAEASEEKSEPFPRPEVVLRDTPLYKKLKIVTSDDRETVYDLEFFSTTMDNYCMGCGESSVFKGQMVARIGKSAYGLQDKRFAVQIACARDQNHTVIFWFLLRDYEVIKVGQYPSMADIATGDLNRYRKVLPEEMYKELSRAVGLASHGIGIGAFVYLRRIFEMLIEKAHQQARSDKAWTEDEYQRVRMEDKIALLKQHLPPFLVENHLLYGILSKHLHELSEDECLDAFSVVRMGIEMILDDEIAEQARKGKVAATQKEIARLHQQTKGAKKRSEPAL